MSYLIIDNIMKLSAYKKLNLRDIQLIQLEVMKEIHNVCLKHNIKYYLIAGSLLGAIRHKGFIPWDDDIDIAMFRDDYEHFKKVFYDEFDSSKYFLQHYDSDVDFKPALMRFCVRGTLKNSKGEQHLRCCKNMFIDIFPLDNAPDSIILRRKQSKQICRCKAILNAKLYTLFPTNSCVEIFAKRVLSFICKLYPIRAIQNRLNTVMQLYNGEHTKCVCSMASQYEYNRQCIDRSIYGIPKLIDFEDTYFFVPENPSEYLEHLYGKNFLEIPPTEKRRKPDDVYIV